MHMQVLVNLNSVVMPSLLSTTNIICTYSVLFWTTVNVINSHWTGCRFCQRFELDTELSVLWGNALLRGDARPSDRWQRGWFQAVCDLRGRLRISNIEKALTNHIFLQLKISAQVDQRRDNLWSAYRTLCMYTCSCAHKLVGIDMPYGHTTMQLVQEATE